VMSRVLLSQSASRFHGPMSSHEQGSGMRYTRGSGRQPRTSVTQAQRI
jgi:hypothetical protein